MENLFLHTRNCEYLCSDVLEKDCGEIIAIIQYISVRNINYTLRLDCAACGECGIKLTIKNIKPWK